MPLTQLTMTIRHNRPLLCPGCGWPLIQDASTAHRSAVYCVTCIDSLSADAIRIVDRYLHTPEGRRNFVLAHGISIYSPDDYHVPHIAPWILMMEWGLTPPRVPIGPTKRHHGLHVNHDPERER